MSHEKEADSPKDNPAPRPGYNPFQGGYTPRKRDHERSSTNAEGLPAAPQGGTGEAPRSIDLEKRARRGSREEFEEVLEKVPDVEPVEGDEL